MDDYIGLLIFVGVVVVNILATVFKKSKSKNSTVHQKSNTQNFNPSVKKVNNGLSSPFGDLKNLIQNLQDFQEPEFQPIHKKQEVSIPKVVEEKFIEEVEVKVEKKESSQYNQGNIEEKSFNVINSDFFKNYGHQAIILNEILSKPKALQEV